MSGSTRSKKSPLKEIPDAVNNKFLELEAELARQKTATIVKDQKFLELEEELARQKTATTVQEKETGELKEIARQQIERANLQTELARQREEENQRLVAQLAEMQRHMDNSSLNFNLNTPQVPLPPIPRAPTGPTATSTPSGIWGMPETANQGNTAARSLGPALQNEGLQDLKKRDPCPLRRP